MLNWIREKFGTVIISGIIGFIAFVFVFYGVFNPKATRGLHDGAVAGLVNGDAISISDFRREYSQRVQVYREMMKLTDEQLKQFHLGTGVFYELVRRKLAYQQATKNGMLASDDEVRDKIREIPNFQKDGNFDLGSYKQILEANGYSPASFERLTRERLSQERWLEYFRNRVHVSEAEIRSQFLMDNDKRAIRYVILTTESGKRGIPVSEDEIKKFLSDPAKVNLVKQEFEAKKTTEYKGKDFEFAQHLIVQGILAGEKLGDIRKLNEKLSDQVLPLLVKGGGNDSKINALLKPYQVQVKTTSLSNSQNMRIPAWMNPTELIRDAFAEKSPIDPMAGGKAKKYASVSEILIAVVDASEKPDLKTLETQHDSLASQIAIRKESELFDQWMQDLMKTAKIEPNNAVVGGGNEEG